jgi:hypothetical protein
LQIPRLPPYCLLFVSHLQTTYELIQLHLLTYSIALHNKYLGNTSLRQASCAVCLARLLTSSSLAGTYLHFTAYLSQK